MSEEKENDGSWSGLVKTLVGTAGTLVAAGGAWLGSHLFGGDEKPETAQPAQTAAPVINITNANQQAAPAAGKTVIVQQAAPAAAQPAAAPKKKTEKEALQEEPKW